MRRRTNDEAAEWSVTDGGLTWTDEKGIPLQVDQVANRLLASAFVVRNGYREYWGKGQTVEVTPAAFHLMAAAVEDARKERHVSREEARRIGDEALEAALKAARLGQLELPVTI